VLLTRLPLGIATSFDLHVLGTPPALVLSQDQTLHKTSLWSLEAALKIRIALRNACETFPWSFDFGATRLRFRMTRQKIVRSRDSKDIAMRRCLLRRRPTDLCAAALFSFQGPKPERARGLRRGSK
jgi:hypothetical protein